MVSVFTANVGIEEPARGDDVGTWDTPVNNNSTLIDLLIGGSVNIALNNSNVILAANQFQCRHLTFNSTLTGSVSITFPTSFKKAYEIEHLCTGSSAFTITLATTASGGQVICPPPGETIECWNDGSNIKFKNLARVGQYWDYGGSSVPNWVSGCTVPPYLNCDGTAFSSATYPALTVILGSTTLPDSKGRGRMALDQGAGRVSSAVAGFSPNTVGAGGGSQSIQAHTHANSLNDPSHVHGYVQSTFGVGTGTSPNYFYSSITGGNTNAAFTGMTITNASYGAGGSQNMQPTFVSGLTLIRAA